MKTLVAVFLTLVLITGLGCQSTKASKRGGIAPVSEQFSIVVPASNKVTQGSETTVGISLNRDSYFKQNVKLEIAAKGLRVTPTSVLVKASDLPDVALRITADKDAALGKYSVSIKGTPDVGESTSIEFPVKVEAPEVIKSGAAATR